MIKMKVDWGGDTSEFEADLLEIFMIYSGKKYKRKGNQIIGEEDKEE